MPSLQLFKFLAGPKNSIDQPDLPVFLHQLSSSEGLWRLNSCCVKKCQEDKVHRPMRFILSLTLHCQSVDLQATKIQKRSSNSFSKMFAIPKNFNKGHDRIYGKNKSLLYRFKFPPSSAMQSLSVCTSLIQYLSIR